MSSSDPLSAPRPSRHQYGKRALAGAQRSAKAAAPTQATRRGGSIPTSSSLSSPISSPGSSPTRAPPGEVSSLLAGGASRVVSVAARSSPRRQSPRKSIAAHGAAETVSATKGKGKQSSSAGRASGRPFSAQTGPGSASQSLTPSKRALASSSTLADSTESASSGIKVDLSFPELPAREVDEDELEDGMRSPPRRKRNRLTPAQLAEALAKSHTVDTSLKLSDTAAPALPEPPTTPKRNGVSRVGSAPQLSPLKSPAKDLAAIFNAFSPEKMAPPLFGRSKEGSPVAKGRSFERTASGSIVASMGGRTTPRPRSPTRETTPPSWVTGSQSQPLHRSAQDALVGFVAHRSPSSSPQRPPGRSNTPPDALPFQPSAVGEEQMIFQGSQFQATAMRPSAVRPLGLAGSSAVVGSSSTAKRTYGDRETRVIQKDEQENAIYARPDAPPASSSSPGPEGERKRKPKKRTLPAVLIQDRQSYSALRDVEGADETEEYEKTGALSDLRTVTQQRARGENSRFEDKFQYMVEGLGPDEPLSVRRSSAVEVLRKMLDKDFTRRLKSTGLIESVYTRFRRAGAGSGDRVLDPALAYLIATAGRDQRVAEALLLISPAQFDNSIEEDPINPKSDSVIVLAEMLQRPWAGEVVGPGVKGLSKAEVLVMRSLRETIDKSDLIEPSSFEVTLRSLALVAVSVVASFDGRANFKPQERLATGGVLDAVLDAFVFETKSLELRIARYSTGLDLLPPDGSVSLTLIDTCLRLFEALSSSCAQAVDALERHRQSVAPGLVNSLLVLYLLTRNPPSEKTARTAVECLLSSLRQLIQLTLDPDWCATLVAEPTLIGTLVRLVKATRTQRAREGRGQFDVGPDDGKHNLDVLCFSLGVLASLAELADEAKHAIRKTLIDPNCKEDPRCGRECQCAKRASAVHILLDLHADPLDDVEGARKEETEEKQVKEKVKDEEDGDGDDGEKGVTVTRTFVDGYAALLLGLIAVDASENQEIIAATLERDPPQLKAVLDALDEFASIQERQEQDEGQSASQAKQARGGAFAAKVRETVAQLGRQ